ncbi:MAG: MFS transporter [Acidimicrobiaceae bacterium]|nr:MFS transporter [Acidimicrobiaceae bacterium]
MASFPSPSGPLSNRQFALLWGGQSVSRFGDGVISVALPLLVLMVTRSATDLGVVVAARLVPTVLFLLLGGALSDRVSRRLAMLVSDASRALISAALGVLAVAGRLNFTEMLLGAVIFGLFDALFYPASTALLPEVVGVEQLTASNSLIGISSTLAGGLLGPLAGGVISSSIGVSWSLIIDGGTFVVSALCLAAMRGGARPVSAEATMINDIRDGLSYCRRTPWLFWSIAVAGVANALIFTPSTIMLPLLFKHVLHSPNWMVGVGFASVGLGGMLGAVAMMSVVRVKARVRSMWLAWTVASMMSIPLGLANSAWLASGIAFVSGALLMMGTIWWNSLMQSEVPAEMLGRVSSVDWTFSLGLSPVGVALAGVVSGTVGVRTTIVVPGIVVGVVAMAILASVQSITDIDRRR